MATEQVLQQVLLERMRQEKLKREGKFSWTCADHVTNGERLPILTEEVGEVARAMCDGNPENLREELIQVAAVAVAWVEGLDSQEASARKAFERLNNLMLQADECFRPNQRGGL